MPTLAFSILSSFCYPPFFHLLYCLTLYSMTTIVCIFQTWIFAARRSLTTSWGGPSPATPMTATLSSTTPASGLHGRKHGIFKILSFDTLCKKILFIMFLIFSCLSFFIMQLKRNGLFKNFLQLFSPKFYSKSSETNSIFFTASIHIWGLRFKLGENKETENVVQHFLRSLVMKLKRNIPELNNSSLFTLSG